jgi:hypothetical protein
VIPVGKLDIMCKRQRTCVVMGKAESLAYFPWDKASGLDVCAVGSAILATARKRPKPRLWVTADEAQHFPARVLRNTRLTKHIPMDNMPSFTKYKAPLVRGWEIEFTPDPFFESGPLSVGFVDRAHSLLFAVQVLYRVGYRKLVFTGCDLHSPELWPIVDQMERWHVAAMDAGMEWVCATERSLLSLFLPTVGCAEGATI